MKLLSPLNEDCDIDELSNYADEYYLGVCDEEWEQNHRGEYNARGFHKRSNFSSWNRLEQAVQKAACHQIPCYLTVNTHHLGKSGVGYMRKILRRYREIGGYGVICSEPDAFLYAKEVGLQVVISTIAGLYNVDAIEMICQLFQPDRIVLHRDMCFGSFQQIRERCPEIELEVFGACFGCKFSNAYCYCRHLRGTGGMCRTSALSEWSFHNRMGDAAPEQLFEMEKNHWLYANYLLDGACGICALYRFVQMGMDSIKIVGRELSGARLVQINQEYARYIRLAASASSEEAYFAQIQQNPVGTGHLGCFHGFSCYYPEVSNQNFW